MLIGQQVTVLGAGIGGLAAAIALAARGAAVRLVEQAPALTEVGAGIQLGPNALAVLRALAVEVPGQAADAVALCDGAGGRVLARLPVGDLPGGYRFIHRADLIAALAARAGALGVQVDLGRRIGSVDLTSAQPVLDGQGADLLIGADGLHSVVRAALTGRVAPFFTHQTAWRALIPGDPGDPAVAEVHMARGRHLVSYPLRGGTLRNLVAVEERRDWAEEGWSQPGDPDRMRAAFAGFSPRVRGWLGQVTDCGYWGLFRHPVAREWGRALPRGAVAILGDAAHPTLPFLAQGAAMALEDAWVLAECLAEGAEDAAALAAYQARRQARATRVVDAASGNARVYHLGGPARAVAHLGLRGIGAVAPGRLLARYDWLYRHDVTQA